MATILSVILKVVFCWMVMANATLAILLIFGQWYIDMICRKANRSLDNWIDTFDFYSAVVTTWPIMLISLPFRSFIDR
jgi:hypothetical protein